MKEQIHILVIAPILFGTIAGILSKTLLALEHGMLWVVILLFCALELCAQFMFVPYWTRRRGQVS